MLFHANFPFMPGGFVGVDVFFVISGYLITGLLLREAITTGRIDLPDFYARRARRILPAATVVLVATLALTAIFLPRSAGSRSASKPPAPRSTWSTGSSPAEPTT
ncbi:acyltransferase family protein [Leucobacter soli]|uniref:acyltransferase family protein n=1 Tax=Leucobacter soli TaxID=2812850 RepID=UPI00360D5507